MTDARGPRISPGGFRQLGPLGWSVARIGARVSATKDIHLFSTLGRARRLFPAWLAYSAMMMPFGLLSRTETELTILRVAHLRQCAYERSHHERIATRLGVSQRDIDNTLIDPADTDFSPRIRAMLQVADRIVTHRDMDDQTWAAAAVQLSESELVSLVQLVIQYDGLATGVHVLGIEPDAPR